MDGVGGGVLCVGRGVMVIDQARCQPETPSTEPAGYPFGVRIYTRTHTRDIIPFSSRGYITAAREPTN